MDREPGKPINYRGHWNYDPRGMDREPWKPINYRGHWNYDPRGELLLRARLAQENNDDYVAIPVKLAIACADLHECLARTILTEDEDGPLSEPLEIFCRKPRGHDYNHSNRYCEWENT